jgi:hypothetical protein
MIAARRRRGFHGGLRLRPLLGRPVHVPRQQDPAGLDRPPRPKVDGDALAQRELPLGGRRGALADEHAAARREPRHPIGRDRRVARHHGLRRLRIGNDDLARVDADPDVERGAQLPGGGGQRLHGAHDLGGDAESLRGVVLTLRGQTEDGAQPVAHQPVDHPGRAGRGLGGRERAGDEGAKLRWRGLALEATLHRGNQDGGVPALRLGGGRVHVERPAAGLAETSGHRDEGPAGGAEVQQRLAADRAEVPRLLDRGDARGTGQVGRAAARRTECGGRLDGRPTNWARAHAGVLGRWTLEPDIGVKPGHL